MLDIKKIVEEKDIIKEKVVSKGCAPELVDKVCELDEKRRSLTYSVEALKMKKNTRRPDRSPRSFFFFQTYPH